MRRTTFDVTVTLRLRVGAASELQAEALVLDLFDDSILESILASGVQEAGLELSPSNPKAQEVAQ
jgi:hypothetical protein